ncbi:MAG: ABC transporter ATP-binding protein/permease [Oscillospiraceae bacterium]|jgi:ATP-binding cassette subfamily B protein|nr:ABC transporter ATP-binding protein/permease [Oscillospiraceae bacterium]
MEVLDAEAQQSATKFLSNRQLPHALQCYKDNRADQSCFAVVGDLTLQGRYGESALLFYPHSLVAYDSAKMAEPEEFVYADFSSVKVRRFYGNAIFQVIDPNGKKRTLLRFTYAVAEVAEAAGEFVNAVNKSGYTPDMTEGVRGSFERLRAFCPKCGRKLRSIDSPCLNCTGKKQVFGKFWPYFKPRMPALLLCMLLSVATTALDLVPAYVTGKMVDSVLPSGDLSNLAKVILFLLAVYVVQYTLGAFRAYYLRIAGNRIIVDLKKDIYAKAQFLPMSFFDKTSTGSVINRVNGDANVLQQFILRMSQDAVVRAFLMVGLIIIMFAMDWKLSLFSLAPVPLVVYGGRLMGKKIAPKYRRIWRRGSAIYSLLADTIPGVRVIKAFTNENSAIKKFARFLDEWYKEDRAAAKISAVFPNVMTFLITCGSLIVWGVGGSQVINGTTGALTIGTLVTFITYASKFYDPVNFFATLSDSYQNTLASVEKILDILDAEPERDFGKGSQLERVRGRVEFRNVNFSFDRSKKVLTNINLVIEPGDTVGIVGTTGSGKSTLINLIMRYYDDYDGEIYIDGVNLRDVDMEYYRSQIGYVQQEPLMFKDSIFRNIAYGAGEPHVEEVLYAAEVANAHGFIARLPDAYDTMLGERGVGLSGGEKQRISIARAVLKNPSILIFDEATAAVDSETEHLIQAAIERLIRGRTTLMIAHRLSTLRKANKIVVVDKGEIIEFGSPQELMAKKGKYYKLVQIQSMAEEAEAKRAEENF